MMAIFDSKTLDHKFTIGKTSDGMGVYVNDDKCEVGTMSKTPKIKTLSKAQLVKLLADVEDETPIEFFLGSDDIIRARENGLCTADSCGGYHFRLGLSGDLGADSAGASIMLFAQLEG